MNSVVLLGRLTKDVELKTGGANNTLWSQFTVAVNRRFKDSDGKYGADFISCRAFGKIAENISKYLHKGSQIAINGHIQTGSYKNKDGNTVYTTDVMIDGFDFVDARNQSGNGNTEPSQIRSGGPSHDQNHDDDFMNLPDGIDEELPFA